MSRQVEEREMKRVEESETIAEGTQDRSDWPRSARQLGQRNPKITKLGTVQQLPRAI
jgi:hypothetical protein